MISEKQKRILLKDLNEKLCVGIEQADRGELIPGDKVFEELAKEFDKRKK